MQTAKQLSVSLVNKPGRLVAMLGALGKEKVNFRALSVMDSGERGTVRFVPDDAAVAIKVLEDNNIRFTMMAYVISRIEGPVRKSTERVDAEMKKIEAEKARLVAFRGLFGTL